MNQFKKRINNPPHIYVDDTFYFVTAATYQHQNRLASQACKQYFVTELINLAAAYHLDLKAWVVLNNHYHILFRLSGGNKLAKFFKRFHAKTATYFNQIDNVPGRRVWWNYWDRCIRNDRDFWQHFNYIHYNPIKHKYVNQLSEWPHSSLFHYLENQGREWLDDCWRSYPIREFQIEYDVF